MKFYDEAAITVISGRGGDGVIAGRREAGVPFGGPAGGDGGRGGAVRFQADENITTLMHLRYQSKRKAAHGQPGQSRDKYGAHGEDLTIPVPVGTFIKDADTGAVLAHLTHHQQRCRILAGGRGGVGNIHFKNAHNQFPNIAFFGEPSQQRDVLVELQLLGDIALIGTPSTGKSSLINAVTNVQAKTADYEFTTLVPHLGIVDHKGVHFSMIDIPGLIAGAHEGKGLGNVFLRHILKARARVIMLNIAKDIPGVAERGQLLDEITQYIEHRWQEQKIDGHVVEELEHTIQYADTTLVYSLWGVLEGERQLLLRKHIITVANKLDLIDTELWQEYEKSLLEHMTTHLAQYTDQHIAPNILASTIYPLSTMSREGIVGWLDACITLVQQYDTGSTEVVSGEDIIVDLGDRSVKCEDITEREKPLLYEEGYISEERHPKARVWSVCHDAFAYYCYVLPRGNDEAELWFWSVMEKEGYLKRLSSHGVKKGDVLKIHSPYLGTADRYILWE